MAFYDGVLYVSSRGEITRITDEDGDGEPDSFKTIVNDIPVPGKHQNNGLATGPDGKLYVPIGPSCDACGEVYARGYAASINWRSTRRTATSGPPTTAATTRGMRCPRN